MTDPLEDGDKVQLLATAFSLTPEETKQVKTSFEVLNHEYAASANPDALKPQHRRVKIALAMMPLVAKESGFMLVIPHEDDPYLAENKNAKELAPILASNTTDPEHGGSGAVRMMRISRALGQGPSPSPLFAFCGSGPNCSTLPVNEVARQLTAEVVRGCMAITCGPPPPTEKTHTNKRTRHE